VSKGAASQPGFPHAAWEGCIALGGDAGRKARCTKTDTTHQSAPKRCMIRVYKDVVDPTLSLGPGSYMSRSLQTHVLNGLSLTGVTHLGGLVGRVSINACGYCGEGYVLQAVLVGQGQARPASSKGWWLRGVPQSGEHWSAPQAAPIKHAVPRKAWHTGDMPPRQSCIQLPRTAFEIPTCVLHKTLVRQLHAAVQHHHMRHFKGCCIAATCTHLYA